MQLVVHAPVREPLASLPCTPDGSHSETA
jgi:hypothetical protein